MYSLVLATMLTAGGTTVPATHHGNDGHGCYGCSCYGCYGCHGGCNGCSCYGGGYQMWSCFGQSCYGYFPYGYTVTLIRGTSSGKSQGKGQSGDGVETKKESRVPSDRARIVVNLPEDADLFVDGDRATLTSAKRTMLTPALQTDRKYSYTLRAEITRNGKKETQSKKISFRAGQVVKVNLNKLEATETAEASALISK